MTNDRDRSTGQAGPARRPLVVTATESLLEDLLQLAATVGVDLDVAPDPSGIRRRWEQAPCVVVGADRAVACAELGLPRRDRVVLVGDDLDDAGVWQRAVGLGAEHVVFLPDAQPWLSELFAEAADGPHRPAPLIAVIGGRGGAGATTLAAALAVTATRWGSRALLVDADPLGGGIDLVFGAEHERGLRWPDLGATRGRLPGPALAAALPRVQELSVLSWDRGEALAVPVAAMEAVLGAGRRGHDLVVVDLPRSLDACSQVVLADATAVLLVLPAEVRAAAAAARVAAAVTRTAADLRLVVRGPCPSGLTGAQIARMLGLPLAGELPLEPGLTLALERGQPPARAGRGPLADFCATILAEFDPGCRSAA